MGGGELDVKGVGGGGGVESAIFQFINCEGITHASIDDPVAYKTALT